MKKLNKLQINLNKLIDDEQLKSIRGGELVDCALYYDGTFQRMTQYLCYGTQAECDASCANAFYTHPDAWCFCNYGY
jgi:hypothetical protein